jgi:hypothetical protein
MADERSTELIARHAEATEKFDYFVTGITLALLGWLGGRTGPLHLRDPADICYLLALVVLLGSAFAGLKTLETKNTALRLNALALLGEETASWHQQAAHSRGMLVDAESGKQLDRMEVLNSAQEQLKLAKQARQLLEEVSNKSVRWYSARSWFLMVGLAFLILGRILEGA